MSGRYHDPLVRLDGSDYTRGDVRDPHPPAGKRFPVIQLSLSCKCTGCGTGFFLPLLLIELYGFHKTLRIGAILNVAIAISAFAMSIVSRPAQPRASRLSLPANGPTDSHIGLLLLLFITGLATMGMELIWIRLFTPYVGPMVYSFGMILVAYLLATFVGSQIYRYWSRRYRTQENRLTWVSLALLGMLPLLTADYRVPLHLVARVFVGVMPFAGMIGFLTPMLVDRWSGGDPDRAGRAYAVNVAGCIAGPLLCGFLLLPQVGERWSVLLFALPWFVMAFSSRRTPGFRPLSRAFAYAALVLALCVLFCDQEFRSPVFRPQSAARLDRNRNCAGRRHETATPGERHGNDQTYSHH